jgi:N-acetylglucosaminyldiphosphoundecaprenol N-acetyl-beta-D-mannosaminyltransferase
LTAPVAPSVLGLPVDCMTPGAYAAWICDTAVRRRTSPTAASAARQVVTLNPEMVMAARHDPALHKAIHQAALVVPDGIGIVWAARVLGFPLLGRIPGVDLLDKVASLAVARSLRLFLLGAAPGVAREAARRLAERYAGLPPVATLPDGLPCSPAAEDAPAILDAIRAARPDLLFVAFGSPAQECWIADHRGELACAVAVGVGGALDFLAGTVPRAPRWMRRLGLEWAYRLVRQPWRWRRMLVLPHFALAVLYERWRGNAA